MRNFCNCALLVCCVAGAHANLFEEQVNRGIPDGDASGLASTLNLTGISDSITSLEVTLNISGTYNGDLYAYLVHDGGFSVLLNRVGRTSNNDLGYGDGGLNVTFADGAANGDIHNYRSTLFGNASTALSGPLTGTWSPDGRQSSPFGVTDADARTALLSSFDGLDPNGAWTLFVADLSGGDLHQLNGWGIEFGNAAAAVPDSASTAWLLLIGLAVICLCGAAGCRFTFLGLGAKTILKKRPVSVTGRSCWAIGLSLVMLTGVESLAGQGGNVTSWGFAVAYPVNGYGARFIQISAQGKHNLALTQDGIVVAWGSDNSGESDVPPGLSGVRAIAAGEDHGLALKNDGTVVAWGYNSLGQCDVPTSLSGVLAIAAGTESSIALRDDGTIEAWGNTFLPNAINDAIAITSALVLKSDGTIVNLDNSPTGLSNATAIASDSLGGHALALKADGTVVAWGKNWYGESDVPDELNGVTAIAAGYGHSVALKSDGTVVCWGWNGSGQCNVPLGLGKVTAIAAGEYHTLALLEDGTVAGWGEDSHFQTTSPNGLWGIAGIASGLSHSLALASDGTVHAWGNNDFQQTAVPAGLRDVVAIAANDNSLALKTDGTLVSWGGRYGLTVPTGLNGVAAIAAGLGHNLALKSDGTVIAWGYAPPMPTGLNNVVAIAAGGQPPGRFQMVGPLHDLALKIDGTVVAWGDNSHGQCNVPGSLADAVAIAAGDIHSLALKADGTVVAWGDNSLGQCDVPGSLSNVIAVAAGGYHSVALKADGSVVIWGNSSFNQYNVPPGLHGATAISAGGSIAALFGGVNRPPLAGSYELATASGTAVSFPLFSLHQVCSDPDWDSFIITGVSPSSAAGGTAQIKGSSVLYTPPLDFVGSDFFTYTVRDSRGASSQGTVHVTVPAGSAQGASMTGWGSMVVYPLNGYGATFTKIASSFQHSLAIKNDGTVVAWGANGGACDVPSDLAGVTAVAAGGSHSLALKADGTVSAWGNNYYGQCDVPRGLSSVAAISAGANHSLALKEDGTVVAWPSNFAATEVPGGLSGVVSIAAGGEHSLALKADGTVIAWGNNYYGQCDVPAGLMEVAAIAAGYSHSLALKADGTVVAWGRNVEGECNVPSGLIDITAVAAGGGHSLALKRDGTVIAWGDDTSGQSDVPVGLRGIVAIAAGNSHSLALNADGGIVAWGSNEEGQTAAPGGGTQVVAISANRTAGMALKTDGTLFQWGQDVWDAPDGLSGVVSISMGPVHNLALKKDGTVVAWGDNYYGQCDVPPGLAGVVGIAAGFGHSLVLKADGTVVAWGWRNYPWGTGQSNAPPDGLREVVAIATGSAYEPGFDEPSSFDLALKEDGTVVAWGTNSKGQCDVPSGLSGVVAVAAGGAHSLALKADGTVVAWGWNYWGQCDVPVGLTGILAIAAGERQSLALKGDGTVVAWGDNSYGQCSVPSGLSGVISIATGLEQSLALFGGIDQPPVTGTYKLATSRNSARSMPLFKLHLVCDDPDWDSFIITGVSPNTAAGGTAQINGSTILYTPALDFVGTDSFTYTVRDSRGASSQGTIHVTVTAPSGSSPNVVGVSVASDGSATVRFVGIPEVSYVIDASTDLVHWDSIGSVTAGANGLFEFVDPQAGNYTSRYYRTRHDPQGQ